MAPTRATDRGLAGSVLFGRCGTPRVIYQITALRSTLRGNPAEFNVNFGNSDKGAHHHQRKDGMGMAA